MYAVGPSRSSPHAGMVACMSAVATTQPQGPLLDLRRDADARALFYDAVTEVIVPALELHGIAARLAWQTRVSETEARALRPALTASV